MKVSLRCRETTDWTGNQVTKFFEDYAKEHNLIPSPNGRYLEEYNGEMHYTHEFIDGKEKEDNEQ